MVINQNGIEIEANVVRNTLQYKVLNQSDLFTENLKFLRVVSDEQSGYSLKTNNRPNYNKKLKRMFVRGSELESNDSVVKVKCETAAKANEALQALERMVAKVTTPEFQENVHHPEMGSVVPGGCSHYRFSFINRAMATVLQLTGHKLYPEEIQDIDPETKVCRTKSTHYFEHGIQAFDVLKKACGFKNYDHSINAHSVSEEDCKEAVELLRSCFQHMHERGRGKLIAFWRAVTYLRGSDMGLIPSYGKKKSKPAGIPSH